MSKRPQLIATDLDGTIVKHDGSISKRTVEAFTAAHELGIHIFFVTGRPPRWMHEIRETFNFGDCICGNGAMLYDLKNDKVTEEWMLTSEQQLQVAQKLRAAIPPISFAIESHDYFHREKKYVPRWDIGLDNIGVDAIEDAVRGPAFKMLARCSDAEFTSDQMLEIAQHELDGLVTVTHSNARESLLEISALGVSKGMTLAKVAGRLSIDAKDCVSFGDNPNDFSMLQWCGRSYAMADGHPDGVNYATSLAPPHSEDGVAIIIEELLQLPA